jgi:hypothetical protein
MMGEHHCLLNLLIVIVGYASIDSFHDCPDSVLVIGRFVGAWTPSLNYLPFGDRAVPFVASRWPIVNLVLKISSPLSHLDAILVHEGDSPVGELFHAASRIFCTLVDPPQLLYLSSHFLGMFRQRVEFAYFQMDDAVDLFFDSGQESIESAPWVAWSCSAHPWK